VGDGVGEEAVAGTVGANADEFGGPGGGDGVGGELDDVEVAGLGVAEGIGHELELASDGGGEVVGFFFVLFGDEGADVGDAGDGERCEELAGDDGAGEAGFGPVEGVLFAVVGKGFGFAFFAGADDAFAFGDGDVELGGEAVGEEAGHWEPAAGVEEDADGIGNLD